MTYDTISKPQHYNWYHIECKDITKHCNFYFGNVIKYVYRYEHKNQEEDLKKAKQYLLFCLENHHDIPNPVTFKGVGLLLQLSEEQDLNGTLLKKICRRFATTDWAGMIDDINEKLDELER